MTFRVVGTSPSGTEFKSTLDANGQHVPHVNIDSGGGGGGATQATTVAVYNTTLTLADTEYSQALPANTLQFRFRCRTIYDVRFAFVTGKVAGPVAPYLTLPAGMEYYSDQNDLTGITLFLASAQAGVVVELEVWT